jgi:hypothetical protein
MYSQTGQQFISDPNGQKYYVDSSGQYHSSLPTHSVTTPATSGGSGGVVRYDKNGQPINDGSTGGSRAASTSNQSYTPDGWNAVTGYYIPQTTATQTLSPQQQAILDQTQGANLNLGKLANQQSAKLVDYLNQPVDLSNSNVDNYINSHYSDDFNRTQDQQAEALRTQLANQGIGYGTEAYTRATADAATSRANAHDNMYGAQRNNAIQEILTQRNQPLNEISSLLGGSQITAPTYASTPQTNIPTTDVAGIQQQAYQNNVNAVNAKNAATQSTLGGLFGLGGKLLSLSDKRAKTNIKPVGKLMGQKIYSFSYKGAKDDGQKHIGVMAQEVQKTRPEAVSTRPDGLKQVDYGRLFAAGKKKAA